MLVYKEHSDTMSKTNSTKSLNKFSLIKECLFTKSIVENIDQLDKEFVTKVPS